jgi:NAD(P)-dependent dehydrogenase (short-subunit alcohol dehydrogenase family)
MSERLDLRGRTVLITGAARGIGAGLAREVARRGARPALVGIELATMQAVADEIEKSHGVETFVAEADVRDRAALAAAVEGTVAKLGGIDVVVANAGIETAQSIASHDPQDFENVIAINLIGVFNTLQATIPHVTARRGHLLPIASLAAAAHAPSMSAYAASKAGCEAIANVARIELAGTGVSVGCGYFSFLDTDMVNDAFDRPIGAAMRSKFPGPMQKVYPLAPAIKELADGIEERGRVVAYPHWVRGILRTRGFTQQLTEKTIGDKATEAISEVETPNS